MSHGLTLSLNSRVSFELRPDYPASPLDRGQAALQRWKAADTVIYGFCKDTIALIADSVAEILAFLLTPNLFL